MTLEQTNIPEYIPTTIEGCSSIDELTRHLLVAEESGAKILSTLGAEEGKQIPLPAETVVDLINSVRDWYEGAVWENVDNDSTILDEELQKKAAQIPRDLHLRAKVIELLRS